MAKIIYISGSPRSKSNTDYLLNLAMSKTGGQLIKLSKYKIIPCTSCRCCLENGICILKDDMSGEIIPLLLESDAIIIGTPVYFNNVSAQVKAFMDRTWPLRGKLKNKIGGAIVVGRRYGLESAISAINAFFLKHEIIPANRGVCGIAYESGEISKDQEAINATLKLADRILELLNLMGLMTRSEGRLEFP